VSASEDRIHTLLLVALLRKLLAEPLCLNCMPHLGSTQVMLSGLPGLLQLAGVLTLPAAARPTAMAASASGAPPPRHGAGAAQWRQMRGIVPR